MKNGFLTRFEDFLMHFRAFLGSSRILSWALGSSRILSWAEVLAECGAIDEFWLKKNDFLFFLRKITFEFPFQIRIMLQKKIALASLAILVWSL